MSTLPAAGYLDDAARTNAEQKAALEDQRDVISELLGAADATELTIASGSVTAAANNGGMHTIDTESDAATDDLTNIVQTNTPAGRWLMISTANDARQVVAKHAAGGAGQLLLADDADFTLESTDYWLLLRRSGTSWVEIARSYGADTARPLRADAGHISGLVPSNGTDADHDIDISAGSCVDSTGARLLRLTSAMTKQIDATWAAGSAAGGLFTGSVSTATWYHLHAIRKDSDGSVDVGFDTSLTAVNRPAGYTHYRRLGSVLTDGSANIIAFDAVETGGGGLHVHWAAPVLDVDVSNQSTSSVSRALTVPSGLRVAALIAALISHASAATVYLRPLTATDAAPSQVTGPFTLRASSSGGVTEVCEVYTDTSRQIGSRSDVSSTTLRILTLGWRESRR